MNMCHVSVSYPTLRSMSAERARDHASGTRRIPTQQRSRRRVEGILDAAERLVVTQSVEELSTRAIAQSAEVPVASLYQYFADKEEVLLAL
ncbi:MAG: TetR family transcriptional regulator, partial [Actinobacteria bacterium]|nr:TetR family transcriptional regulator [Actinomycetota bacterium]